MIFPFSFPHDRAHHGRTISIEASKNRELKADYISDNLVFAYLFVEGIFRPAVPNAYSKYVKNMLDSRRKKGRAPLNSTYAVERVINFVDYLILRRHFLVAPVRWVSQNCLVRRARLLFVTDLECGLYAPKTAFLLLLLCAVKDLCPVVRFLHACKLMTVPLRTN